MEEGYDTHEFMRFLQNAKFEGDNIDNWSMEELMGIVDEFRDSQKVRPESLDVLVSNIKKYDNTVMLYHQQSNVQYMQDENNVDIDDLDNCNQQINHNQDIKDKQKDDGYSNKQKDSKQGNSQQESKSKDQNSQISSEGKKQQENEKQVKEVQMQKQVSQQRKKQDQHRSMVNGIFRFVS